MSEDQPAHEIVHMLNEYFEMMVDVIFQYEGTLDKFIGDEIMAIWGAPVSHDDDIEKAVQAAVHMQAALQEFNELRRSEGMPALQIGIGLASGRIVAGYMGSTKTMSYTVIGSSVNLASRLCSASGPGQILVTQEILAAVRHIVTSEACVPLHLKGISRPVEPVNITGLIAGLEPPSGRRTTTVDPAKR
jgi:adenylate cyclase